MTGEFTEDWNIEQTQRTQREDVIWESQIFSQSLATQEIGTKKFFLSFTYKNQIYRQKDYVFVSSENIPYLSSQTKTDESNLDWIGQLLQLWEDEEGNKQCILKLFFRPEQTTIKKRPMHGEQQLLHSNCIIIRNIVDITGICTVDDLESFRKRGNFPQNAFYCDFKDFSSVSFVDIRSEAIKNQNKVEIQSSIEQNPTSALPKQTQKSNELSELSPGKRKAENIPKKTLESQKKRNEEEEYADFVDGTYFGDSNDITQDDNAKKIQKTSQKFPGKSQKTETSTTKLTHEHLRSINTWIRQTPSPRDSQKIEKSVDSSRNLNSQKTKPEENSQNDNLKKGMDISEGPQELNSPSVPDSASVPNFQEVICSTPLKQNESQNIEISTVAYVATPLKERPVQQFTLPALELQTENALQELRSMAVNVNDFMSTASQQNFLKMLDLFERLEGVRSQLRVIAEEMCRVFKNV